MVERDVDGATEFTLKRREFAVARGILANRIIRGVLVSAYLWPIRYTAAVACEETRDLAARNDRRLEAHSRAFIGICIQGFCEDFDTSFTLRIL